MTTTYVQMFGKHTDYKQCKECMIPNWYENENCVHCGHDKFYKDGSGIIGYIEEDYRFYMDEEGYTESEVDNIEIDI